MKNILKFFVLIFILSINIKAQNYWQSFNGPCGGSVSFLSTGSNGYIYAGGQGGIYYSTNAGNSWSSLCDGINDQFFYEIFLESNGNILVGTDQGLYRSIDGGKNWDLITSKLGKLYADTFTESSEGCICMWDRMHGTLYSTTDDGNSWNDVGSSISVSFVSSMTTDKNGSVYIATYDGLYHTTNNGANWDKLKSGVIKLVATDISGNIFVNIQGSGLFRSSDNGVSWNSINSNSIDYTQINYMTSTPYGQLLISTGSKAYLSGDSGNNWASLNIDSFNLRVHSLAMNADGYIFAGTYSNGVYVSSNNGTGWNQSNNGLKLNQIGSVKASLKGTVFALFPSTNVVCTNDNGSSWKSLSYPVYGYFWPMICNSAGDVFGSGNGGIWKSTDEGASWTQVLDNVVTQINCFTIGVDGKMYAGAGDGKIWISSDNGTSWTLVDDGKKNNGHAIDFFSVNSAGELFIGDNLNVYHSFGPGQSWSTLNIANFSGQLYSIVTKGNNFVFIACGSGILRSVDDGASWSSANNGISNPSNINGLIKNNVGYLFASSKDGVYESTDNGNNWILVNSGLPKTYICSLDTDVNGYLYAGTYGAGVFKSNSSTIPPLPDAPAILSPAAGASGEPLTLELKWNASSYAENYILQVSKDTNFINIVKNDSAITSLSDNVSGLSDGIKYYWRVAAINARGKGPYSIIQSFSTILNKPENLKASAILGYKVQLSWTGKSNNASGYSIERKTSADTGFVEINRIASDQTVYIDTTIKAINLFNYRIKAFNLFENSLYSNIETIGTIPNLPAAPVIASPADSASGEPLSIIFSWNNNEYTDSYRLQVSSNSSFSNLIVNDSAITSLSKQVSGLKDGIKYYWRVGAKNTGGIGPYSTIRSFSTKLNAPENLKTTALWGYKVLLNWNAKSQNASGYSIERKLSTDINYAEIKKVPADSTSYTDTTISTIAAFNYRVKAFNTIENSDYSNVETVNTITAIENKNNSIPDKYELSQNYPNPFNPSTIIQYGLPLQSEVRIKIYSILGNEVKTYAGVIQNAGYHTISFDGKDLSSGIYLYKLEVRSIDGSKQFRQIKKMLLLK